MMKSIIYTNGSHINSKTASLLKHFHYLSCVRVSIDGLKKTNDLIRGEGMFKKAIRALNLLSLNKVSCEANFTISNINFNDLSNLSNYLRKIHLDVKINIGTLKISEEVLNHKFLIIPEEKTIEVMEKVKLQLMSDPSFKQYQLLPDFYFNIYGDSFGCPAGRISISIDSQGNVFGCGMFSNNDYYNCGNLIHDSIANVWNNENMLHLRDLKARDECLSCSNYTKTCTGGCRGNALSCFGDISMADINCATYKLTYN